MDREQRIAEIAAELAEHGPAADTRALLLLDELVHTPGLDGVERWDRARLILAAWTLLRGVAARDALGDWPD